MYTMSLSGVLAVDRFTHTIFKLGHHMHLLLNGEFTLDVYQVGIDCIDQLIII